MSRNTLIPWKLKQRRIPYPISDELNETLKELTGTTIFPSPPDKPWRVLGDRMFLGEEPEAWMEDWVSRAVLAQLKGILSAHPEYQLDKETRREAELRMDQDSRFWFYHV